MNPVERARANAAICTALGMVPAPRCEHGLFFDLKVGRCRLVPDTDAHAAHLRCGMGLKPDDGFCFDVFHSFSDCRRAEMELGVPGGDLESRGFKILAQISAKESH
jgi:hypothetical protein